MARPGTPRTARRHLYLPEIYGIRREDGLLKIGRSVCVGRRIWGVRRDHRMVMSIEFTRYCPAELLVRAEHAVHGILYALRREGEWFDVDRVEAENVVEQVIRALTEAA